MINVENLKPFPKFCYTIGMIPTSYKESLTYEEQLMWFCDFLQNTVIPTVNNNGQAVQELQNLYIQLRSYVDNYFTNLNIQNEINNKLDLMASDGTLAKIINQDIFNELNNNVTENTNNINILNDKVTENTNNINEIPSKDNLHLFGITTFDQNDYAATQGGCILENNIIAVIQNKDENNNAYLKKINYTDGSIISSVLHTDLSHGQSMCYNKNENKLVITAYNEKKLIAVNAQTLNTISFVTLAFYPCAIAFNNEHYYISDKDNNNLYVFDTNFTLVNTIVINYLNINNKGIIDLAFNNNKLIALNNYARFEVDINNGNISNFMPIDRNVDNNIYLSEFEFFDFIEKDNYILGSILYPSLVTRGFGNVNSAFVYFNSSKNYKEINKTTKGWTNSFRVVYVDNTNINYYRDGSIEKPYINIYEAVNASSAGNYNLFEIYLKDNYSENRPLICIGTKAKSIKVNANNKNISGFLLEYNSNITLVGNPNISGVDFSIYEPKQTNCAFFINSNSHLTLASATYTGNNKSFLISADSSVKTPAFDTGIFIDWDNVENTGKLEFLYSTEDTNYNPNCNLIGTIKNYGSYYSGSMTNQLNIKLPINGGVISITFEDSTREQLLIFNKSGSYGNSNITATTTAHSAYLEATIKTKKNFDFARISYL